MKKIMFNDKYGLTDAVLKGHKTMTRRVATYETVKEPNTGFLTDQPEAGTFVLCDKLRIVAKSTYKIGEVVAVAQSYKSVFEESLNYALPRYHWLDDHIDEKGYANKMFVEAVEMPHQIKITNIKVERLRDISSEDCLKEGIEARIVRCHTFYYIDGVEKPFAFPKHAFAALIDKVSGKGTWEGNPWVFVYSFKLIDQ